MAYNCSTNVLPSSLVDQSIIDENDYRLAFTAEHAFCDFAEGRGGGWGVCKIDQETF